MDRESYGGKLGLKKRLEKRKAEEIGRGGGGRGRRGGGRGGEKEEGGMNNSWTRTPEKKEI